MSLESLGSGAEGRGTRSSQESGSTTIHDPLRSQPRSGAGVERALVWTRLAGAVRDPPSTEREKRGGELLGRETIADGG